MLERRHFKQTTPLNDRLTAFVEEARQKATELPPGPERDEMLKKARQADTACQLDAWANSLGPRPPALIPLLVGDPWEAIHETTLRPQNGESRRRFGRNVSLAASWR
jgi:hypothetical protein